VFGESVMKNVIASLPFLFYCHNKSINLAVLHFMKCQQVGVKFRMLTLIRACWLKRFRNAVS